MNTKTGINIKIDKKLRGDVQRVVFSAPPISNKKTAELLNRALRDVKQGKNVDGPFISTKDALAYLHN